MSRCRNFYHIYNRISETWESSKLMQGRNSKVDNSYVVFHVGLAQSNQNRADMAGKYRKPSIQLVKYIIHYGFSINLWLYCFFLIMYFYSIVLENPDFYFYWMIYYNYYLNFIPDRSFPYIFVTKVIIRDLIEFKQICRHFTLGFHPTFSKTCHRRSEVNALGSCILFVIVKTKMIYWISYLQYKKNCLSW